MASTFASDLAGSNAVLKTLPGVCARVGTYSVAAALVIDDVIQAIPVYAGETVVGLEVVATDLDTNGTPLITLDVGDGDTADRFIAASTVGQAGGSAKHDVGVPYTYAADDTVDVKVKAAPATGATSGTVTVMALIQSN
jgi:hypothetical protein